MMIKKTDNPIEICHRNRTDSVYIIGNKSEKTFYRFFIFTLDKNTHCM